MTTAELVWFKRDLRVADHSPLVAAARRGPVVCLYIYEPDIMAAEDFSRRHLLFINDSLRDLDAALRERVRAAVDTQRRSRVRTRAGYRKKRAFNRIRVHQETTNGISLRTRPSRVVVGQRRGRYGSGGIPPARCCPQAGDPRWLGKAVAGFRRLAAGAGSSQSC